MSGTPTDASSECGHPASELLDFHVNGSLEGDEAAMVAAHVAECAVCARDVRELQSISESIAMHGVARSTAWPPSRRVRGWLGAAAAVIVVGVVVSFRPGPTAPERIAASAPAESGAAASSVPAVAPPAGITGAAPPSGSPPGSIAPPGTEVPLDLGGGILRAAGSATPHLDLDAGVSVVRLTLRPPVVPGVRRGISVLGPGDEEVLSEMPLPPYDSMGRVEVPVQAARLARPGTYRVIVTSVPTGPGGPDVYPFEVSRAAGRN